MLKCLMILAFAFPALATERLILVGGGDAPEAALSALAHWTGGAKGKLLVVTWSSNGTGSDFDYIKDEFRPYGLTDVELSPTPEEMATQSQHFLEQLERATGIYFSGGDQNDFMAVVERFPVIRQLLVKKVAKGVPIYGTSAGTAVMAQTMFTGNYNEKSPKVAGGDLLGIDPSAVIMGQGLSLLRGILVDQHFFVRRRQNRFWSAWETCPENAGLGIDEATAVILEDQRWVQVAGRGSVLAVKRGTLGGADQVFHLKDGEKLDLTFFRKVR